MFLFNFFRSILNSLGLGYNNGKILFLGLDNAGKTTLLHMLKTGKLAVAQPTLYPNQEELVMGGVRFRTFDLGGHETAQRIWKDYYAAVNGVVFIIDAADRTRFDEVREVLTGLLEDPALAHVPIAILGNKIDIPSAASEDELRERAGIQYHMTSGKEAASGGGSIRPLELFMVSIQRQMGYVEAFQWLAKFLD
jgi:GTP-binding protein SAR1